MDNATFRKQKAALTRAVNSGNRDKIIAACRAAVEVWNSDGPWPDDWSRWQRALDDSYWALDPEVRLDHSQFLSLDDL